MGKKVYVFGAGASEGAGLPLMSNFLKKAKELQEKQIDIFEDVWEYLKVNKLENFNIEMILGYLDMKISLSESNSDEHVKSRLLGFIEKTIALSYYYSDDKNISVYSELLKKFVDRLTKNDVIISFNYDVLIRNSVKFK